MNIIEQIDRLLDKFNCRLTNNDILNINSIPFDSIDELCNIRVVDARLSKDDREGILVSLENEDGVQYVIDVESA